MAETMLDAANLGIGKGREGGYGCVAPAGTNPSAYEDMKQTLKQLCDADSSVLKSLGYIDEDGVTLTTDTDTDDKKDWCGNTIVSPMTSYAESVQANFLESRASVLKVVFGESNVTDDGKGTVTVRHNQNFTGSHLYVFDCVVSDTKVKRTIIPNGVITERDDIAYNNSDLVGYKPTIKCLPSAFYGGDTLREFIYDTVTGAASQVTGGASGEKQD